MPRAATALPTTPRHTSQRLWAAHVIAWALLLGCWLVLGTLGRRHLPQVAGDQLPVAVWLATVGVAWALTGRWRWSAPVLRSALLVTGLAAAAALALSGRSAAALLWAAGAWALLLVLASFAVRGLRQMQPGRLPAQIGPALVGAALAWVVAGDLDALRQGVGPVVLALGLAALALALLLPSPAPAPTPANTAAGVAAGLVADVASGGRSAGLGFCQAGLFDCAVPLLQPGR